MGEKTFNTRKLIAHGPSSLTIALPRKWIKKYKLQKGDVVRIEEGEKGLQVLPSPSQQKKSITLKLKNDEQTIISILTTIYRRGYDNITVKYSGTEPYTYISNASRNLPGLTVVGNSRGKCIIKSLPTEIEQDFSTLFRRVFLIILQELDDLVDMLNKPKELKYFYRRDADLNALVNLAVRMINKGFVHDRQEELYLFYALLQLEELGDDLVKFSLKVKDGKAVLPALKGCSKMLRMLYDAYFKKSYAIDEFYKYYYLYFPDFPQPKELPEYCALLKDLSKKGIDVFYLRSFIEKVNSLAEILLLPKVEEF